METGDYIKNNYVLEKEGLAKVCKWAQGKGIKDSPHIHEVRGERKAIMDDILDAVGFTPLVRLNNITSDVKCEVLAKCEFLNPGGSVKDRIGRRMVLDAEKAGRLNKGDIIIEPTSGNTGIGLSMAAAARGYKMIITMPEKMSAEKENALKALGAEVVRTPTELLCDHIDSHIGVAETLNKKLPNSHILDQYANPSNPLAHYEGTAKEIYDACEGKIDTVVLTAGTGGTVTGIARFIKDQNPNIRIVAVDPKGSILAEPATMNSEMVPYQVEGIGYDFIPRVLDRTCIDKWYKSTDADSFYWSRRAIAEEGLLCGGSSGGAIWAAMEEAKTMEEGQRVVVILPDSIRNYMTKFLSDDWMYEYDFITEEKLIESNTPKLVDNRAWGLEYKISDMDLHDTVLLTANATVKEAITKLQNLSFNQLPVANEDGKVVGVVTTESLIDQISKGKVTKTSPLGKAIIKTFRKTSSSTPLSELGRVFTRVPYVIVDERYILTHADFLTFFKDAE